MLFIVQVALVLILQATLIHLQVFSHISSHSVFYEYRFTKKTTQSTISSEYLFLRNDFKDHSENV